MHKKIFDLADALRSISAEDWAHIGTGTTAQTKQTLRRARAAAHQERGRHELCEDDLLLSIERYRRGHGCSVRLAIVRVLKGMTHGGEDREGNPTVRMPDGHWVSKPSAQKRLEAKMRKHQAEVSVRVDAEEWGRERVRALFPRLPLPPGYAHQSPPAAPSVAVEPSSAVRPRDPSPKRSPIPLWALGDAARPSRRKCRACSRNAQSGWRPGRTEGEKPADIVTWKINWAFNSPSRRRSKR